jgi:hypothetical protein
MRMQIKTLSHVTEKFLCGLVILLLMTISSACKKEKPSNAEPRAPSREHNTARLPGCDCDAIHNVKQKAICELNCRG